MEMVYDETANKTKFAVFNGADVKYTEKITHDGIEFFPYAATNHLISKKVVLFPSEATEYGSEKELLDTVQSFIHKYLDISPFYEKMAAYYIPFTWLYDKFGELPYLRPLGDYGTGKTRFLQVIGSISYKPMFVGGATTTSPIFRIVDGFKGTLILDEADYRFSDTTSEIVKILNSGYQKGSPVLRSEGKRDGTFETKAYDVFCPKIIATRKHFHDPALESRCLIEEMEKKELREDIPINLSDEFYAEAIEIRNKLLMWRFRNYRQAGLKIQEIDRKLEPRLNQIITPLLSIIQDGEVKKEIKQFIVNYNNELFADRGMSFEADILRAILLCCNNGDLKPTMQSVSTAFNANVSKKEEISPRRMGHILRKDLKLKIEHTRDGNVVKNESDNSKRITELKRKFGITDDLEESSVNNVNDVNVSDIPVRTGKDEEIDIKALF